ncbi:MAG: Gldg family protein [Phycisphaeraceae bacterium]|nr:Gldg family protein [Phycisphaeraceae bacterium]
MPSPTQTERRIKYGLNIAVAIGAAVFIAFAVNFICYNWLFKYRGDLTATRKYSLSEQTRKVLASLKGDVRIVTLISSSSIYTTQTADLVDDYSRYSGKIKVEHINPALDVGRVENFYKDLQSRYASRIKAITEAVELGGKTQKEIQAQIKDQAAVIGQILEDSGLKDDQVRQFIQSVAQNFGRIDAMFEKIDPEIRKLLAGVMPDYSGAMETMKANLNELDERLFSIAMTNFAKFAKDESQSAAVREKLLRVADMFRASRQTIEPALTRLRAVEKAEDYDKLREQLGNANVVVVLDGQQVRVTPVEEMYRRADNAQSREQSTENAEPLFLGEEKITGALVAMSLDHPPLVVFVQGGKPPVVGYQGQYEGVAQLLRNMNFEVKDWSPMGGRPNPYTGQPSPPGPPPQPQPGQKCIWIVTPVEPGNPMMGQGGAGPQIAEVIGQRIAEGDGAMLILPPNPMSRMGMPDPLAELAVRDGITVEAAKIVLKEIQLPNRKTGADTKFMLNAWPQELPITQALAGSQGIFVQCSPIKLQADNASNAKTWPLAVLRDKSMWAESDFMNEHPTYKKDDAGDSFVVAAAAEQGERRLVVVADQLWATDQITTYGPLGPGSAQLGAMFPANADLFVNSVYWLGHMDQLIAASARSQDIRRIEDMSAGELSAYRWVLLLGIPLLIAGAGIAVWLVRRGG